MELGIPKSALKLSENSNFQSSRVEFDESLLDRGGYVAPVHFGKWNGVAKRCQNLSRALELMRKCLGRGS